MNPIDPTKQEQLAGALACFALGVAIYLVAAAPPPPPADPLFVTRAVWAPRTH